VITDRHSLVQLNRALPSAHRVTDTTMAQINTHLASMGAMRRITDTTLIQVNMAVEGVR
jgi:hypothetical protein